jgi:pseudouridine-5'-phosphate glycosidase
MINPLDISPRIAEALAQQEAIVAFETTILSFGLPHPLNEEVAFACEVAARGSGAVPATVALLDGKIRVGLRDDEIQYFCSRSPEIQKVNLQNFAAVLASGRPGALTVAASVRACALAGIRVFATGGIGGVHRGFSQTLDISSDLRALAEYPVAVVCAGAKSVLHIPATLETLETLGVPVVGFRTTTFPMFFTRDSHHELDTSFDDAADLARFLRIQWSCGGGGALVVTPVPAEHAIPPGEIESWISTALADAACSEVSGKRVTPFLLERLEELSGGRTLDANRALVMNNATVAAQVAAALCTPE